MRADEDRLLDMVDAIDAILSLRLTAGSFRDEPLHQVWCLHHITVIGEAASRVSDTLRQSESGAPWRGMIGMRNAIVHGYFQVDWEAVWVVVERDLPELRSAITEILERRFGVIR